MSQGIHKVAIILCDSAGHYNFVVAKPPVLKKKLQNGHYTLVSEPFFRFSDERLDRSRLF